MRWPLADNPPVADSSPKPDPSTNDRTAAFWDQRHRTAKGEAHDNFLRHPLIQAYISLRAFGQIVGHLDVVAAELQSRTRPGDEILSVGCGPAGKERALARKLPDRRFVAIDISPETVGRATQEIQAEGLENLSLALGDFNDLQLDAGRYRAILGLGAIHHVEALESFWQACSHGLTDDGVVLAQEFVGPNRFQWTDTQIEIGDAALRDLVPESHKVHHQQIRRTPVDVMLALDPSEAVRSRDILPTCRDAGYAIEGYASAGCALLQPVLMYQIDTFEPSNWEHNHVLSSLFREEDRRMRAGELEDDFAMFVARPPR
jgi:SAM-dependent methyltransferase